MLQINIKLFAHLRDFMPAPGIKGGTIYNCPVDNSVNSILRELNVPLEHCHLVLLNGAFVQPHHRETKSMVAGDTLAVWPPIAGGQVHLASQVITKDMTTTRREFFRCLEVALDDMAHTIDGNHICVNNDSKEIAINIAPLPPRELSKTMVMERWQLTIKFSDHDEVESSNFMKKFNRAFHRGGG